MSLNLSFLIFQGTNLYQLMTLLCIQLHKIKQPVVEHISATYSNWGRQVSNPCCLYSEAGTLTIRPPDPKDGDLNHV